jgi:hypothetical protein
MKKDAALYYSAAREQWAVAEFHNGTQNAPETKFVDAVIINSMLGVTQEMNVGSSQFVKVKNVVNFTFRNVTLSESLDADGEKVVTAIYT